MPHILVDAEPGDVRAAEVLRDAAIGPPAVIPEVAAELIRQAFTLLPARDPRRAHFGIEAIELLTVAWHTEDALTLADTLLGAGLPAGQTAEVEDRAADALWNTGQTPRILRRVEAALALDGVPPPLRARLSAQRALAQSTEEPETAWAAGREALAAADETGDDRAWITARRALGEIARNDGRNDVALGHFRELRALTAETYFADEVLSLQLLDRYDESAGLLHQIRAELELPSSSARVYAYHFAQMWQDFCVGHLDDAETAANTLLRLGDDLKQLTYHNEARVLLGRIAQLRGEYDTARDQLRRVIPPAGHADRGTPFLQRHAQALLAAAEDDPATALRTVHAMLQPERFLRHRWRWQPTWFLEITPIAVAGGDAKLAGELAGQAQELADRNPAVQTNAGVAALVGGLVDGDLARMDHGTALLRDSPRPSIRATGVGAVGCRGPASHRSSVDPAEHQLVRVGLVVLVPEEGVDGTSAVRALRLEVELTAPVTEDPALLPPVAGAEVVGQRVVEASGLVVGAAGLAGVVPAAPGERLALVAVSPPGLAVRVVLVVVGDPVVEAARSVVAGGAARAGVVVGRVVDQGLADLAVPPALLRRRDGGCGRLGRGEHARAEQHRTRAGL